MHRIRRIVNEATLVLLRTTTRRRRLLSAFALAVAVPTSVAQPVQRLRKIGYMSFGPVSRNASPDRMKRSWQD
jgi:hypothetical protein